MPMHRAVPAAAGSRATASRYSDRIFSPWVKPPPCYFVREVPGKTKPQAPLPFSGIGPCGDPSTVSGQPKSDTLWKRAPCLRPPAPWRVQAASRFDTDHLVDRYFVRLCPPVLPPLNSSRPFGSFQFTPLWQILQPLSFETVYVGSGFYSFFAKSFSFPLSSEKFAL